MSRCKFTPELFSQSQLIFVLLNLGRLEQTANLLAALELGLLRNGLLLLLLHAVELRVVVRELLERDKEVAELEPEPIRLGVEAEEALDESLDLRTVELSVLIQGSKNSFIHHISLERLTVEGWGKHCGATCPQS